MPTVLFIEDHPIIIELTFLFLEREIPDIRPLKALTGAEGLAQARAGSPDVVLLDLSLPDIDGFELIGPLRDCSRPPAIVIMTGRLDEATFLRATEAEVAGLLWKGHVSGGAITTAFTSVISGQRYESPQFTAIRQRLKNDPTSFIKRLSPTELRLLPLFGVGLDDVTIGRVCSMATATAKNHRRHVLQKLSLHSSLALVGWCVEHGFVSKPPGGGK